MSHTTTTEQRRHAKHPWQVQMDNEARLYQARRRRQAAAKVRAAKERNESDPEWRESRLEYYREWRRKRAEAAAVASEHQQA